MRNSLTASTRTRSKTWGAALVTMLLAVAGLVVQAPAAEAAPCVLRGTSIGAGGVLSPGECLRSSNGQYDLNMQLDGNLVLYRLSDMRACWSSETSRAGAKMYVKVNRYAPDYVETTLSIRPVNRFGHSRFWTRGNVEAPTVEYTYNVSINNSGQLWIGWDFFRGC